MKYKRLGTEELHALKKEFIHFLASAQITGPDWESMKKNKPLQAEELIDVFSDMVYEKVMGKIEFLEYRDAKTMNIFHCVPDKITLIGLRVNENSTIDLTAADVFNQWSEHPSNAVKVIKTEKPYSQDRGLELFELIQNGCLITDDRLFRVLSQMI